MPLERKHGIEAGFAWRQVAELTVVYQDLGVSSGMQYGIDDAIQRGCPIEYRSLPNFGKDFLVLEPEKIELSDAEIAYGKTVADRLSNTSMSYDDKGACIKNRYGKLK